MIPYILILLLLCLGFIYELYLPSARQYKVSFQYKTVYFMLVSAVALMTGFRDMIGGYDIYIYAWFFEEVPAIDGLFSWSGGTPSVYFYFEPGYLVLNSVVKFFCADTYFYFFTVALLTYFLIGKAFRRYPFFCIRFFPVFCQILYCGFCLYPAVYCYGTCMVESSFSGRKPEKCIFNFSVMGDDYSLQCFCRIPDVFCGKPAIFRKIPECCICNCFDFRCFAFYQMGNGFGKSFFDAG